jgi:hypothetical protein
MKQYKVEQLCVCRLTYITTAKNEANAAKAMKRNERDLERMQIDFVLPLPECGVSVQEFPPKVPAQRKRKRRP